MNVGVAFILYPSFILCFSISLCCDDQVSLPQAQGQLDCLGQSRPDLRSGGQAVNDHLDVVPHLPVQPQVVA